MHLTKTFILGLKKNLKPKAHMLLIVLKCFFFNGSKENHKF